MDADLLKLRRATAEAARKAFTAVRRAHPAEEFYAFALYTDDGVMTVMPAANSEEGLRRKADELGQKDPAELAFLRWSTSEWAYEAAGEEYFDIPCGLLRAMAAKVSDPGFGHHRRRVHQAMVDALGDLEKEGFFGRGEARLKVAVFASISDSDDAGALEDQSARALNPPDVYRRFTRRYE